jgi:transcriptional regulator with XRE-family HTH domain
LEHDSRVVTQTVSVRDFMGLVVSDRDRHDVGVPGTKEQWKAVGDAVRARREEMGPTQQEAALDAGVGTTIWGEIEGGKRDNFTPRILRRVCAELGWSLDSIDRILRGEEPLERPTQPPKEAVYGRVDPLSSTLSPADQIDQAAAVIERGVALIRQAAQELREGR